MRRAEWRNIAMGISQHRALATESDDLPCGARPGRSRGPRPGVVGIIDYTVHLASEKLIGIRETVHWHPRLASDIDNWHPRTVHWHPRLASDIDNWHPRTVHLASEVGIRGWHPRLASEDRGWHPNVLGCQKCVVQNSCVANGFISTFGLRSATRDWPSPVPPPRSGPL